MNLRQGVTQMMIYHCLLQLLTYSYQETGEDDLPSLFDYAYTKRKEYLSVNRNVTRGSKDEVNVDSLASIWAFDNICLYIHILKQASNKEEFVEKIY